MKFILSNNAKQSFAISMGIGIAVGYIVLFLMLMLSALLLVLTDMPDGTAVVLSTVSLALAGFLCGLVSSKILGSKALIVGLLSGFVFYVTVALISAVVTKGEFTSLFILRLILATAMSGVGSVVGAFRKSNKHII
jgi:putative membrane protein (TIGR04086 family)